MKFYTPFGVKEKKPLTMQLYIKKIVSLVKDLLSPFSHQLISHARSNEFPLRLWLTDGWPRKPQPLLKLLK